MGDSTRSGQRSELSHLPSHARVYDEIGHSYTSARKPDPRIAAQIHAALGDARRVCNVGAGTGSYEPTDRMVVGVEPSRVMLEQRARVRAVEAVAGALPFADHAFDATLAILTLHHWPDVSAGLGEMRRIAPRRVIVTFDLEQNQRFWLVREYLPECLSLDRSRTLEIDALADALEPCRIEVIPVPWDCIDGFQACYWRRPERYLEAVVQQNISSIAQLPPDIVARGMAKLRCDLDSGAWAERHADLLARDEMDWGYRLLISG